MRTRAKRQRNSFVHAPGSPQTSADWEKLSDAEKAAWTARRRRLRHQRRHGPRAKSIAGYHNASTTGLVGRGQLRRVRPIPLSPQHEVTIEGGPLLPTRDPPGSATTDAGLYPRTELRMIRRAQRERWPMKPEVREELQNILRKMINHAEENERYGTIIAATNMLLKMEAQNQTDQLEESRKYSLTREQAAELASVIQDCFEMVDDVSLRQRILSKMGIKLMELGIDRGPAGYLEE